MEIASGLICLSGGLDSLSAAIEASQNGGITHALLIAGADYPSTKAPGFVELRERVARISNNLNLDLIVSETNLVQVGIDWEMSFGLNLGFCMHYLAPMFSYGAFAQDVTEFQDLFLAPWGNFGSLSKLLTTENFRVDTYGRTLDRPSKLKHVAEYDESLLDDLSVCYSDKSTGKNCGECVKCVATRAAFLAFSIPERGNFVSTRSLAELYDAFEVPRRYSHIRTLMIRNSELLPILPDGTVRSAIARFDSRLRVRYHHATPPFR